jgi:hypothetical protein
MTRRGRFGDLVRGFSRVRLAVVGDLIADEFIYGQIDRVSREAPVLILSYTSAEIVPGGAGNAANNAARLGARVDVVGVVGRDDAGSRLIAALPAGANVDGVARGPAARSRRRSRGAWNPRSPASSDEPTSSSSPITERGSSRPPCGRGRSTDRSGGHDRSCSSTRDTP